VKKILFITYFFPPLGGSGVQRPVKQVKYFRKNGWIVDVVSVKDIIFNSFDSTLLEDCGDHGIHYTKTFDLMGLLYLLQKHNNSTDNKIYNGTNERLKSFIRTVFPVDEKVGWFLPAVWKAIGLIKNNKYDLILSSCLPATSGLIAYFLSKVSGIPFAVDFRDLYYQNPYPRFLTSFHKRIGFELEKRLIYRSKFIVTSTESSRNDLIKLYGKRISKKVISSYNGWDEDDFNTIKKTENKKFVIRFVGNLYSNQTSKFFINAIKKIKKKMPNLLDEIEVNFVGNFFSNELEILTCKELSGIVKITPQVVHKDAIELMNSADLLLIFLSSVKSDGVVPGKLFEYLRTGKAILGMVPPSGECADLMRNNGHDYICAQESVNEIEELLSEILRNREEVKKRNYSYNNKLNRENQIDKLIARIEE
jgi:glycosyltransferase involved in cell wall biosynthesis